jgi:hypothetical protein
VPAARLRISGSASQVITADVTAKRSWFDMSRQHSFRKSMKVQSRCRCPHSPAVDNHPAADLSNERIRRQPVFGGLVNEYERAALKP